TLATILCLSRQQRSRVGVRRSSRERTMIEEPNDLRRTWVSLFYLVTYLFPLAVGLLISPTGTFHLLGSEAEHATTAWRLFGGLLLVLAMVVLLCLLKTSSAIVSGSVSRRRSWSDPFNDTTSPEILDAFASMSCVVSPRRQCLPRVQGIN